MHRLLLRSVQRALTIRCKRAASYPIRLVLPSQWLPSRSPSRSHYPDRVTIVIPIFEILKNLSNNFKKSVALSIKFDPTKVGNNQKDAIVPTILVHNIP